MYITDIVYLLDVLVVIVYMSFCNCWDYLLLHEDWGECSEDWAGACRWGGGEVEFLTEFFFPTKFFKPGMPNYILPCTCETHFLHNMHCF